LRRLDVTQKIGDLVAVDVFRVAPSLSIALGSRRSAGESHAGGINRCGIE